MIILSNAFLQKNLAYVHLHRAGLRREALGVDVVLSFFFQSDVKRFSLYTEYHEKV